MTYTQIGVPLSLYSGKTRAYFLHKRIPFIERGSNFWEFAVTIPKRVKAAVVPVVITPEGEWLGDTSAIIDKLEQRFPERPVLPETPVLRFAAYLFELWADEFWTPLAMHTRWSHPENLPLFVHDAGDGLLGGMPRWLKNLAGRRHAGKMRDIAAQLGINDATRPLLDRFLEIHLDALDLHFAEHRFLFGNRPSLGDYGLIAPLYAHLGRDPWSKRELIAPRKNLEAWIERMFEPETSADGEFWTDDQIPETLTLALRSIFDEMVPFLQSCADLVAETQILASDAPKARRFFAPITFPLAGGTYERAGLSYPVWMAQRMQDAFKAMPEADQQAVKTWLREIGGESILRLSLPKVARVGLAAGRVE